MKFIEHSYCPTCRMTLSVEHLCLSKRSWLGLLRIVMGKLCDHWPIGWLGRFSELVADLECKIDVLCIVAHAARSAMANRPCDYWNHVLCLVSYSTISHVTVKDMHVELTQSLVYLILVLYPDLQVRHGTKVFLWCVCVRLKHLIVQIFYGLVSVRLAKAE